MVWRASRRAFLTGSAATALGLPLLLRGQAQAPPARSASKDADVIVVGAGMAGISAARDLRAGGLSVIVLEGRDRVGGRLWTRSDLANTPLDLGGQFIHRAEDNVLNQLTAQFQIPTHDFPFANLQLHETDGSVASAERTLSIVGSAAELVGKLLLLRAAREALGEPDISVEDGIAQVLAGQHLSDQERRDLDFAIGFAFEFSFDDPPDVSLYHFGDDENSGLRDFVLDGGYNRLTDALAAGLDIRRQHAVTAIDTSGSTVKVTTADHGHFEADRVVVTTSIGVLRSGSITFSPPLGEQKRGAIGRLHMGAANKLFLQFPRVFWAQEPHLLQYIAERRGEWLLWANMFTLTGKPILEAIIAGGYSRRAEQFSDQRLVDEAMAVLQTMYGRSIPQPEAIMRSRWVSDPFALGAYSHLPPGATPHDFDLMAEQEGSKLFFAGEATFREFPGSVQGAHLSGRREAAKILAGAHPSRS